MRIFLVFVVCFLPASCLLPSAPLSFFLLFIHSVLCSAFCSAFRLLCSFIPLNISSAIPSFRPSFLPSFKHSFRYLLILLCSYCSLLPAPRFPLPALISFFISLYSSFLQTFRLLGPALLCLVLLCSAWSCSALLCSA